eukprot:8243319-Pyramimonas_sp.AAC.1
MRHKVSIVLWLLVLWVLVVMMGFVQKQPAQEQHSLDAKKSYELGSIERTPTASKPKVAPEILKPRSLMDVIHPAHIFLCSDEDDLRPIVAAVNSTVANASQRNRLVFHLLVPKHVHKVARRFPSLWNRESVTIDSRVSNRFVGSPHKFTTLQTSS